MTVTNKANSHKTRVGHKAHREYLPSMDMILCSIPSTKRRRMKRRGRGRGREEREEEERKGK